MIRTRQQQHSQVPSTKLAHKRITKKHPHRQLTTKNKTTNQHHTTIAAPSFPLNAPIRRQFAIKLVNSGPQQPGPAPAVQSRKQPQPLNDDSEDPAAEDKTPVVYTSADFTILPSVVKRLATLNGGFLEGSKPHQTGLRITVDTGGCSGFQYIYTMENAPDQQSEVGNFNEIKSKLLSQQQQQQQDQIQNLIFGENTGDLFFIKDQHFVVTDPESMAFLKDSQLEYKVELIRSGFMVANNPNVDLACGCGTSFSKKNAV